MLTILQEDERDHHTSTIYCLVDDIHQATSSIKGANIEFEREPQWVVKMEDHDLWIGFLRGPDNYLVGLMAEVASQ